MSEVRFRSDVGVKLVQHVGSDLSVVRAARVSVDGAAADETAEASAGLIRYLMKHRHGTPFEHASMTFLVEAPIFVFREWHRHRVGWSYNETSGRYSVLKPEFWIPGRERKTVEPQGFKPARPVLDLPTDDQRGVTDEAVSRACKTAWFHYGLMIRNGIAREVARTVLPVGTYSSMYATCNPRSLMHFLSLRTLDLGAADVSYPLAEIEDAARQMEAEFARLFPLTHAAFAEFGRRAP
jgi:thymidylate synthase (FAD)